MHTFAKNYFGSMPKGNRSHKRGHRTPVGGPESEGTVQKSIRLPMEECRQAEEERVGKDKQYRTFSDYVRALIFRDLKDR
jgi:hypothetical protein